MRVVWLVLSGVIDSTRLEAPLTSGVFSILSCGAVVSTTLSVPVRVRVELSLNLTVIETLLPCVSTLSIAGTLPSAKA